MAQLRRITREIPPFDNYEFATPTGDELFRPSLSVLRYKSAAEITSIINMRKTVIARSADTAYPYVSAKKAPIPYFNKTFTSSIFDKISNNYRVQYILSGVYRDIGVSRGANNQLQRSIKIDAYLHEGYSGKLISSKSFTAKSQNGEAISNIYAVGSPEFYGTKFGALWKNALNDVASWAIEQSGCLPTISSVLKSESKQITINTGVDSGMAEGDTVDVVFRNPIQNSITNIKTVHEEKLIPIILVIKSIDAEQSVLEAMDKLDFQTRVQVGDIVTIR